MKKIITLLFFAGLFTTAFAQTGRRQSENNGCDNRYQPSRYSDNNYNGHRGAYHDNNGHNNNYQWNDRDDHNQYAYGKDRDDRNRGDRDRDDMRKESHQSQYDNQKRNDDHPNRGYNAPMHQGRR